MLKYMTYVVAMKFLSTNVEPQTIVHFMDAALSGKK